MRITLYTEDFGDYLWSDDLPAIPHKGDEIQLPSGKIFVVDLVRWCPSDTAAQLGSVQIACRPA